MVCGRHSLALSNKAVINAMYGLSVWPVTADVTRNDTISTVDDSAAVRPLPLPFSDSSIDKLRLLQRRSIRKTSVVGSSVVLDCDVPPPPPTATARPPARRRRPGASEYMVKWQKQGIEVPIYIQLDRLPAHIDANYQGRVRLLADRTGSGDDASLEITDVRLTDEGWYECSVVFIGSTDDPTANGTWVYLAVTGYTQHLVCVIVYVQDYDDKLFHKATYGNHAMHHLLPRLKSFGYNLRTLGHGLCVNFIKS